MVAKKKTGKKKTVRKKKTVKKVARPMAYVVRPTEKKSISRKYLIIETLENGDTRWFDIEEHYRWGKGFITDPVWLPHAEDDEVLCETEAGDLYHDLDDGVSTWFNFHEDYTEEDQEYIRNHYFDGDSEGRYELGWLLEGDHGRNFDVEEEKIIVLAPFEVDKVYTDVYPGEVIEANIKLKSKRKT